MESERERLERQIEHLEFIAGIPHANAHAVCAEIIAEKRAALAALDGPAEGMRRCAFIVHPGDAFDTADLAVATVADHVDDSGCVVIVADIPIPTVPTVRGKVQP